MSSSDFSKSSPSLLFNAASMADLLGPRGGSREGGKRGAKGKVVGSKSSADMSKDLISSILKQETGETSMRRVTPGKKRKSGKKKNPSQQQARSSSSRDVRPGHSMSMSGLNASSMMGLGQQSQTSQSHGEVEKPPSMGPLDMARMAHNANNNVHVFAQGMVASSEEKFDGSASDDVNYLERQYDKVQNILKANETKLVEGYEQLVGEAGGPGASPLRFNSEDAKLLLLFAGIAEVDEPSCEDICSRCEVASGLNNEERFAKAAEEFVKREEGADGEAKGTATTTTDSWGNDASLPEVDFHRWCTAVMAALRHRLMAGVLASRRGQLAPNFIEQAEVSANMVSILGPHPSTNRKNKAAKHGSMADANQLSGPSVADDLDSEGDLGADSVTEVRDLADDLFGDSLAETEHAGHGAARTRSADGGGSGARRRGSKSGVMPMDSGSFINNSSFVSAQGSTADGLPPLQMPHNRSQRALKGKRRLQKQAGFDDSFSRGTPRVLHEMSRTDPGRRKAGKGLGGGFGSSQSLAGGESVATAGSTTSKGSRQLQAGASVQDIMALKAELQNTQQGLQQLGSLVDSGIAWVHSNVDMKEIAAGGGLSDRTKDRCKKLAVGKLFNAIGSGIESALSWSFQRWALAVRYEKVSQVAKVYARAKSLETLMRNLNDAMLRQYLKVWGPWKSMTAIKQRWEKEAAAAEVQRTIRGFLGKARTKFRRANKSATTIQCLARRLRAKRRVATRRKYLTLHNAARNLQWFFKGMVLMRKARDECDRRRELKIARKLLREQKAYQDRIQREAEEKMKRESAARKKAANRSAASKIADRADKKAENKKSKGRAAPKTSPEKGGRGSPKNRPAPIDPTARRGGSPAYSPSGSSAAASPAGRASGGSPGAASPYGAYSGPPARSPHALGSSPGSPTAMTNTEEALRMKEEAERFLRENDPAYAELARAQEEELERLRQRTAELEGSQRPSSRGAAEAAAAAASPGKSSRSPSPTGDGEKRGWFGSSSSSSSPVGEEGQEKKGWFGRAKKAPSPSGDPDVGGQTPSRENSIDNEIATEEEGKGGMFGGMFGRKSGGTPPPDSSQSPGASGEADGQPVTRQPSIKEQEDAAEEEEEDEYLSPEQVAEQDRLRAIEEEKRILREKEEAYNESIRQKELELQAEADEKGRAIMERDRIRGEREAKEKAIQDEIDAREKAIQDALDEERRKQEEEEERLEAEEEEREKREAELDRLRQEVIAEERANMQAELDKIRKEAAEQAAQMEAEREELKQLKLDAIGNSRGRGGSPSKASSKGTEPPSPGRGMFGGMFGSRPSSAAAPAKASGFAAGAAHDATAAAKSEEAGGDGKDRPASAVVGTPAKSGGSDSAEERPSSASRLGGMFSSLKGAFSGSTAKLGGGGGGGFGGLMGGGPKRKFKPFDPDTYEFIERDEALRRIQCQIRNKLCKRRIQKLKEKMAAEQKRLGELLLWAIVLIQRTARARQGRHRFRRFKKMKAEAHERLRERSATKIASVVRGKLARKRVKLLWMKRGEQMKAAEWANYQKKTDRKAKLKVLAAGTPRPDVDEDNDIVTWGVDPEQVDQLDQKIAKLEAIEKSIQEREKSMADAQRLSEERAKILEDQLIRLEQRQKAEEAERAMQAELMSNAMGSVPNTGRSTARGPPPQHHPGAKRSARGSAPPSARGGPSTDRSTARSQGDHHHPPASARHSAPPTARSARDPDGIPKDAPRMTHEGVEWVQLWDPDEKATYWYCESTQAAQWETPGEPVYDYTHYDSGYDTDHTSGAMTDYSTDYASGAESEWSEWQNDGEWQEYWDESAQAKYWYNESTGEASWTPPEGLGAGAAGGAASVPASAREMPEEWVSYVDEATGQEYWYNSRTGETSWA